MKKLKLALLGCGKLNEIVANALEEGLLPEYELVAVLGRDEKRAKDFAERHHCSMCKNIEEMIEMKPDFTAEAASVSAVRDYSETIIRGGSNLVLLSIGALADKEFYDCIKQTAMTAKKRVYIASGAVGGFDILRTASLMSDVNVSMLSEKDPDVAARMPLKTKVSPDVKERETVFSGTTKEAIELLPTQVNVAVATALASAGPKDTDMKIQAVPGFKGDQYKIELDGEEVKTELNIYSRTSAIAGWSVVAVLQNAVSPIVF
ncbi:DUF108 domain-containing protein [Blautia liquoris]|uniref:L-aspartate dehydrogenase n=2 Tax=Blautia liquoris TaxID=2779518 RepID=A0A7M2RNM7_9FIRM|nr:DUF108 domain-containing protein [Blautia liquoris]